MFPHKRRPYLYRRNEHLEATKNKLAIHITQILQIPIRRFYKVYKMQSFKYMCLGMSKSEFRLIIDFP